jgi:hypothetical protein
MPECAQSPVGGRQFVLRLGCCFCIRLPSRECACSSVATRLLPFLNGDSAAVGPRTRTIQRFINERCGITACLPVDSMRRPRERWGCGYPSASRPLLR